MQMFTTYDIKRSSLKEKKNSEKRFIKMLLLLPFNK